MFSAFLPSDLEFDVFWCSVLKRMLAKAVPTDWNEPEMAAYIRDYILDCSSEMITAAWASGLGSVPLGLTTYAPNCVERFHLGVKYLLPHGIAEKDLASTMVDVCQAVQTQLEEGDFDNIRAKLEKPPHNLWKFPKKSKAKNDEWDAEGVDGYGESTPNGQKRVAPERKSVKDLVDWHNVHGPEKLFVRKGCDKVLSTGQTAQEVFIFPKYSLHLAEKRKDDMLVFLSLALATTKADVRGACANATTKIYDFKRHIFLRQTFVSVYVCTDGSCVDTHKHFIEGGGWTEHSLFVRLLKQGKAKVAKLPKGPKNSVGSEKGKGPGSPQDVGSVQEHDGCPQGRV